MTGAELLTIGLPLLAIFGSIVANRKSLEDMRDVLRAEFTAALNVQSTELAAALTRIENKIDHVAEMVASHSERLDKLEGGRS